MRDLIRQYNAEKVVKEIGSIEGKNIMVNDTWITKAEDIVIEYIPIDNEIPEEFRSGGEENSINITFNFIEGRMSVSFCPEREVCEVWHEDDNLICFNIQDTSKYVEKEKSHLDFMLKEYTEYMEA